MRSVRLSRVPTRNPGDDTRGSSRVVCVRSSEPGVSKGVYFKSLSAEVPLTEKVADTSHHEQTGPLSLTHHRTNSYVHMINAAPTSVMNGLSHECGAIASVSVISGGNTAMLTAY